MIRGAPASQQTVSLSPSSSANSSRRELKPKIVNINMECVASSETGREAFEKGREAAERWSLMCMPNRGCGGYTYTHQRLSLGQLKVLNREKKRNEKPQGQFLVFNFQWDDLQHRETLLAQ